MSTSLSFGKQENNNGIIVSLCYKGFGFPDHAFDKFYAVNASKTIFLGRLDNSFIHSLDVQHQGLTDWDVVWNQSSADERRLFSEFIEPFPDNLYCNSWLIPKQVSKLRINEATTKNLFIYVHGADMFTQTGMRAELRNDGHDGIFIYNLGLEYSESLST